MLKINLFTFLLFCGIGRLRKCLRSGHTVQHAGMVHGCCGRFHADADARRLACVRNSLSKPFLFVVITINTLLLLCLVFRHLLAFYIQRQNSVLKEYCKHVNVFVQFILYIL